MRQVGSTPHWQVPALYLAPAYPVQHTSLRDRRFPLETTVMTAPHFLTFFSEIEQLGKEIVSEPAAYLRAAVCDADFFS